MNKAGHGKEPTKAKKARKPVEAPHSVKVLAANLRRIREKRRQFQADVAASAGIDYKHYQKIEGAKWPGVRLETVELLAHALGVSMAQLLKEQSGVTPEKIP